MARGRRKTAQSITLARADSTVSGSSDDATNVLKGLRDGDQRAADKLLPIVYQELRELASRYLRRQRPGHTLQPTALVHEAYLRLINQSQAVAADRSHFVGLAARAMRSILVDHARGRKAAKRGGGQRRIPLDDAVALFESRAIDLLALDEALGQLAQEDQQPVRIVELRFFGGLTNEEVADLLGLSLRMIEREWRAAKAWLRQRLQPEPTNDG